MGHIEAINPSFADPKFADPEVEAMARVSSALSELNPRQQYAVIAWMIARWAPEVLAEFAANTEIPESPEP